MAMMVALEEGLYSTFAKIIFSTDDNITFPSDLNSINMIEFSRAFLSKLTSFCAALSNVPQEWRQRENFFIFDKYCSVTFKEINKPAYLTKDDKSRIVCDHPSLLQYILEKKPIPGINNFSEKLVFFDSELTDIHIFGKKFNICDGTLIWKPKHSEFEKCAISDQFKLEENWYNTYLSVWEDNPDYRIYHPSFLSSQSRPPALTLKNGVDLVIYTEVESCGSGFKILNILSGSQTICQSYDLDNSIQKPVSYLNDDPPPPNFENQHLWDE